MDFGKIFDALPPGFQVWAAILLMLGFFLAAFTKKATELKGPLGAVARWFDERQIREVKKDTQLHEEMNKAVERRVEMAMKPLEERLAKLEGRLQKTESDLEAEREARRRDRSEHAEEIAQMEDDVRMREAYIIDVHRWYSKIAMWAAEKNLRLPVRWPSFEEWLRKHKEEQIDE